MFTITAPYLQFAELTGMVTNVVTMPQSTHFQTKHAE